MSTRPFFQITAALLLAMTLLASCTFNSNRELSTSASISSSASSTETTGKQTTSGTVVKAAEITYEADDYYFDWKNTTHTTITLNGGSIQTTGSGTKTAGSTVTITASGTYEITGTLTDGSIVVDVASSSDKKTVFLVLNGASVSSQKSAPIYIKNSGKTCVLLEAGTSNTLYGGAGCVVNADGEPSAALFSKSDLSISGSGTLHVKSDFNDAITSKDILKITDGTLDIQAKSDGVVGKDSLNIEMATITVTAGKDGLRATNDTESGLGNVWIQNGTFTIKAAGDTVSAFNILEVSGGMFQLTSGGGYPGKSINSGNDAGPGGRPGTKTATVTAAAATETSRKGLKAGQNLVLNGGDFTISSYEDAVHSNMSLAIANATLTIQSGDDGIHAETDVLINSGTIAIKNAYEGIEGTNITIQSGKISANTTDDAINVNNSKGVFTINGGEIALVASGDGLDSNGSVVVTDGTITVDGPTASNNGSLDYDRTFVISGGTLVASGSSGMAQAPSESSSQASVQMFYSTVQAAGTSIILKDARGTVVASFTPSKQYSSVALSSPDLKIGETYTLFKDDDKVTSFKISGSLTYLSESGVTAKPQIRGPNGR